MNEKIVLAFSGGLDTSYCAKYLSEEKKMEVYSVVVDTGGFSKEELIEIEKRAYSLGVRTHTTLSVTEEYYQKCIKYLIFGNVLKNNTYPLSVSAERVFQAMAVAKYAKKIGVHTIAHGSTGAGNDQVRFDMIFRILVPNVQIITPIRDNKLSREEEISYLKSKGVVQNWEKAAYSVNKGIWGTSVGGQETLTSHQYLPEEAFPTPISKTEPESLQIEFKNGELFAINKEKLTPVQAIQKITEIAAPFGIGRDIHVGDTIIGIKGRVGFEAAAPLLIIKAHHALEKHCLTKQQAQWKQSLAEGYGTNVHEGQFLEPSMRDIEAFLESTQNRVSGTVTLFLAPYRFHVIGVETPHDLMNSTFGSYGEMNKAWTGEDVRGFSKVLSNSTLIYWKVNGLDQK